MVRQKVMTMPGNSIVDRIDSIVDGNNLNLCLMKYDMSMKENMIGLVGVLAVDCKSNCVVRMKHRLNKQMNESMGYQMDENH